VLFATVLATQSFCNITPPHFFDKHPHTHVNETSNNTNSKGLNFFMVGDYGWVRNMTPAYLTFDKMNEIAGNTSDPRN